MKKLLLRLTPELHAKIVKSSKANDRSINSEIINLLKKALK